MAVAASSVSVTTSATLIAQNTSTEGSSGDWSSKSFALKNSTASATVYLGPSGVTTGTGFPWASTDGTVTIDLEPGEAIYGIVATTSQTVNILSNGR